MGDLDLDVQTILVFVALYLLAIVSGLTMAMVLLVISL